jgi:uncharacterized protein YndB with AHSA1/START domain
MGPVSATITIDAPRERVFALIADLANRPAFCEHLTDFHLQRVASTGVGASARFHADATRFPIWMDTVITEVDPPHRLIERGRGGRANRMIVGTAWELVDAAGGGTEVTVSFWSEPDNVFDRLRGGLGAARWYRRSWKRALRRLREIVEAEGPVEPVRVAGAGRV